jgi:hypothetical protein
MKAWGIVFWISFGTLIDHLWLGAGHVGTPPLALLLLVAALGWGWTALFAGGRAFFRHATALLVGRPLPLPRTDPQALAEEVAALNAQIAQLRDTATSFDVSFDQTLERMDERLRRVEQQSPYVQIKGGG